MLNDLIQFLGHWICSVHLPIIHDHSRRTATSLRLNTLCSDELTQIERIEAEQTSNHHVSANPNAYLDLHGDSFSHYSEHQDYPCKLLVGVNFLIHFLASHVHNPFTFQLEHEASSNESNLESPGNLKIEEESLSVGKFHC